jgi:hypothetical protein
MAMGKSAASASFDGKFDDGGFEIITRKKTKQTSKKLETKAKINPLKTGAVLVGLVGEGDEEEFIFCYEISGGEKIEEVTELRNEFNINKQKRSYCAEENIIAKNPGIRFVASTAFRIDANDCTFAIPACKGCNVMLKELNIVEIEWSSIEK